MKAQTKKNTLHLVAIMRRSRNFHQGGGGGGVRARRPENSLDNVFILVFNLYYSLQRGSNGFITENIVLLQGSRGGPTFSRGEGGPTCSRGKCI